MTEPSPPKIEYPCPNYPIKVLGEAGETLIELVHTVFDRHVEGYQPEKTTLKSSSKGRFQSLTVFIEAQSEAQIRQIFHDLKDHPAVKMVL